MQCAPHFVFKNVGGVLSRRPPQTAANYGLSFVHRPQQSNATFDRSQHESMVNVLDNEFEACSRQRSKLSV